MYRVDGALQNTISIEILWIIQMKSQLSYRKYSE